MKIEINIAKKHLAVIIAAMLAISALTFVSFVFAKTTTAGWTDDRPFHDILYADIIAGKSDDRVIVDDDANVTGYLGVNGNVDVGGTIIGNGSGIFPKIPTGVTTDINDCYNPGATSSGSGGCHPCGKAYVMIKAKYSDVHDYMDGCRCCRLNLTYDYVDPTATTT